VTDYLSTSRPLTPEDVFHAYYDCRKEKRNSWSALRFEERLERNLMQLYRELRDGTWEPARLSCFVVTYPKAREIWASEFKDRVVQCVLYNRWREQFHNSFIYDTYACIAGRGALMGSHRVAKMMRQASQNYQKEAFVLKADFANFFVSIDKNILQAILFRKITDNWDRWLCSKILWTDVKKNALIKSNRSLLKLVPPYKSLFHTRHTRDCPSEI
jgi:RNA-directed DNA polymerase